MPSKGIADSGNLDILLCLVDCGKVKISVSVEKGDLAFQRLLDLAEIDLDHWQSMLDSEVQWLSSCDLVELDHFVVGGLNDCDYIRGDRDLLATHELN